MRNSNNGLKKIFRGKSSSEAAGGAGIGSSLVSVLEMMEAEVETEKKKMWRFFGSKEGSAKKPRFRNLSGTIYLSATLLGLIGGSFLYLYELRYEGRIYPGIKVWGEDMGGKTPAEAMVSVNSKIEKFKIVLAGEGQAYDARAEDLGLAVNAEAMAFNAYSKGRSGNLKKDIVERYGFLGNVANQTIIGKLVGKADLEISPRIVVNQSQLDKYLKSVSDNLFIAEKDSEIKKTADGIELVPAIFGRQVLTADLKKSLLASLGGLKPARLSIKTVIVRPKIVDETAEESVLQGKALAEKKVVLKYKDQTFSPDKTTVLSWINFFKKDGATIYEASADPSKMGAYFSYLESQINIPSVPKKVRVENGVKYSTTQEGKDGLLMDRKVLGAKIADSLNAGLDIEMEIPTYVDIFKIQYQQIVVANWDKYIDINLSTQTMTAYLKGGTLVGTWKVTTGARYTPTPIGTWTIHGKSAITRMTGGIPGYNYYDLPNVHWVSWFRGGGYSIHEAYWRSSFGGRDYLWNGSHGCVNAPYSVAKFIYDWAPIGTPVIVHY